MSAEIGEVQVPVDGVEAYRSRVDGAADNFDARDDGFDGVVGELGLNEIARIATPRPSSSRCLHHDVVNIDTLKTHGTQPPVKVKREAALLFGT